MAYELQYVRRWARPAPGYCTRNATNEHGNTSDQVSISGVAQLAKGSGRGKENELKQKADDG